MSKWVEALLYVCRKKKSWTVAVCGVVIVNGFVGRVRSPNCINSTNGKPNQLDFLRLSKRSCALMHDNAIHNRRVLHGTLLFSDRNPLYIRKWGERVSRRYLTFFYSIFRDRLK